MLLVDDPVCFPQAFIHRHPREAQPAVDTGTLDAWDKLLVHARIIFGHKIAENAPIHLCGPSLRGADKGPECKLDRRREAPFELARYDDGRWALIDDIQVCLGDQRKLHLRIIAT